MPAPSTKTLTFIGAVTVEIVSVVGDVVTPAGVTDLELRRLADGTFLLAAKKPERAPIGVGFRINQAGLIALEPMLQCAIGEPQSLPQEPRIVCDGEHAAPACGDLHCYHGKGTPETRAFPAEG